MTTEPKKDDIGTVYADKVRELSKFIKQKFISKKHCKQCHGRGIIIYQTAPNTKVIYKPCGCLRDE